jgi:hypothetical protein
MDLPWHGTASFHGLVHGARPLLFDEADALQTVHKSRDAVLPGSLAVHNVHTKPSDQCSNCTPSVCVQAVRESLGRQWQVAYRCDGSLQKGAAPPTVHLNALRAHLCHAGIVPASKPQAPTKEQGSYSIVSQLLMGRMSTYMACRMSARASIFRASVSILRRRACFSKSCSRRTRSAAASRACINMNLQETQGRVSRFDCIIMERSGVRCTQAATPSLGHCRMIA